MLYVVSESKAVTIGPWVPWLECHPSESVLNDTDVHYLGSVKEVWVCLLKKVNTESYHVFRDLEPQFNHAPVESADNFSNTTPPNHHKVLLFMFVMFQ